MGFQEKFGINKTFSYAFLDSWSQTRPNDEDPTQQEHWKEETAKLWEYSDKEETFTFMTIDDVLEENAACKEENKRLHDIIDEAIANLTQQVSTNANNIEDLNNQVDENCMSIEHNSDNVSYLSSRLSINTDKISDVNKTVSANIDSISLLQNEDTSLWDHLFETDDNVEENRNAINDISVEKFPDVPIGTIISWVMMVDKNGGEVAKLPKNWQKCDGSVIEHGIWEGKYTPNLNGERRFLRGGNDNDVLTLEEDQILDHFHDVFDNGHSHLTYGAKEGEGHSYDGDGGGGHIHNVNLRSSTDSSGVTVGYVTEGFRKGDENRPKNMNVVFVIRIA